MYLQTLKSMVCLILCLLLMLLFSCNGNGDKEDEGEADAEAKGGSEVLIGGMPLATEPPDGWPCDTCLMILELVDSRTGEAKAAEKTRLMRGIVWPPDTSELILKEFPKGKYHLKVELRNPKTNFPFATFYYSSKAPMGVVRDMKDAEVLELMGDTMKVEFEDLRDMTGRP